MVIIATVLSITSLGTQVGVPFTNLEVPELFIFVFNLDKENNIPTYLSSLLLAISFFLLRLITLRAKSNKFHWSVLTSGPHLISIDEAHQLQEKMVSPVREIVEGIQVGHSGILHFSGIIIAVSLVIILGKMFLKFLARLPARTRWLVMLGVSVFLGTAIGVEMLISIWQTMAWSHLLIRCW